MALQLVLIRGLPGSGKSTYAKTKYPTFLQYETDHLFCDVKGNYRWNAAMHPMGVQWIYELVERALRHGESVALPGVFATCKNIQKYADLAENYNAKFSVIEMQSSWGSIHNVPLEHIQQMRDKWEAWPTALIVE